MQIVLSKSSYLLLLRQGAAFIVPFHCNIAPTLTLVYEHTYDNKAVFKKSLKAYFSVSF